MWQEVAVGHVPRARVSARRRLGGDANATVETGIDGREERSSLSRMVDDQDVDIVASAHGHGTKI
jgi:hypothetical protein